jgi:hypothetical protein
MGGWAAADRPCLLTAALLIRFGAAFAAKLGLAEKVA